MKYIFASIILLLIAASPTHSSWGISGCFAQPLSVERLDFPKVQQNNLKTVTTQYKNYHWILDENRDYEVYLYNDAIQVGAWSYVDKSYRPIVNNEWGNKQNDPPFSIEPPESQKYPRFYFGVMQEKLSHEKKVTRKGIEISYEEAMKVISDDKSDKIPDDSKKFRLTIIGPKVDTDNVKNLWAKEASDLKPRVAVWGVTPDSFALKDTETGKQIFKNDGKPGIYFTAPDGQVLHRQDDFNGSQDFTAIRKAIKAYDDSKDPDLRKPSITPIDPKPPVPSPNIPEPKPSNPNPFQGILDWLKDLPIQLGIIILGAGYFIFSKFVFKQ